MASERKVSIPGLLFDSNGEVAIEDLLRLICERSSSRELQRYSQMLLAAQTSSAISDWSGTAPFPSDVPFDPLPTSSYPAFRNAQWNDPMDEDFIAQPSTAIPMISAGHDLLGPEFGIIYGDSMEQSQSESSAQGAYRASCKFCAENGEDGGAARPNDMKRHYATLHFTGKIWVCIACPLIFDGQTALKSHVKNPTSGHPDTTLQTNWIASCQVKLRPQLLFACGYKNCKKVCEAKHNSHTMEEGSEDIKDLFRHLQEHIDANEEWSYSRRMENLISYSFKDEWKKAYSKDERKRLEWHPHTSTLARKMLECRTIDGKVLPAFLQYVYTLGTRPYNRQNGVQLPLPEGLPLPTADGKLPRLFEDNLAAALSPADARESSTSVPAMSSSTGYGALYGVPSSNFARDEEASGFNNADVAMVDGDSAYCYDPQDVDRGSANPSGWSAAPQVSPLTTTTSSLSTTATAAATSSPSSRFVPTTTTTYGSPRVQHPLPEASRHGGLIPLSQQQQEQHGGMLAVGKGASKNMMSGGRDGDGPPAVQTQQQLLRPHDADGLSLRGAALGRVGGPGVPGSGSAAALSMLSAGDYGSGASSSPPYVGASPVAAATASVNVPVALLSSRVAQVQAQQGARAAQEHAMWQDVPTSGPSGGGVYGGDGRGDDVSGVWSTAASTSDARGSVANSSSVSSSSKSGRAHGSSSGGGHSTSGHSASGGGSRSSAGGGGAGSSSSSRARGDHKAGEKTKSSSSSSSRGGNGGGKAASTDKDKDRDSRSSSGFRRH